jgi:hypothetical protein
MAYASWSVVFGEQPSASKWNILGTNDASFNDGTGISDGVLTASKLASTISASNQVLTAGTTASTSYTATLTGSSAPAASVTVGANGKLLALWRVQGQLSTTGNLHTSVALSGTNTVAASDNYRTITQNNSPVIGFGTSHLFTGLSTGSTTVTMNYRVSGGTGTFSDMEVIAIAL